MSRDVHSAHCTAVLIGWDPATPPPPPAFGLVLRGRYWSVKIHVDDPLHLVMSFLFASAKLATSSRSPSSKPFERPRSGDCNPEDRKPNVILKNHKGSPCWVFWRIFPNIQGWELAKSTNDTKGINGRTRGRAYVQKIDFQTNNIPLVKLSFEAFFELKRRSLQLFPGEHAIGGGGEGGVLRPRHHHVLLLPRRLLLDAQHCLQRRQVWPPLLPTPFRSSLRNLPMSLSHILTLFAWIYAEFDFTESHAPRRWLSYSRVPPTAACSSGKFYVFSQRLYSDFRDLILRFLWYR